MFTVSVGHNYEGYHLEAVWQDEALARWHARRLRREDAGDSVRIERWTGRGTEKVLVTEWHMDYNSKTRRMEWYGSAA